MDVITLFPDMFTGVMGASILGKAAEKKIVSVQILNFREFSGNKHNTVDDYPYGGGGGMVLKPEPIFSAVEQLIDLKSPAPRIILMCPQGEPFSQQTARALAQEKHLIFICGHYEGYDERIRQHLATDEISIGDYVLTGGEIPAMVVMDSVIRLLPGVLGNDQSAVTDSFSNGLLEHPHYTRPPLFRDWEVPEVLLSGHHEHIEQWRKKESIRRTFQRRPELLEKIQLSGEEKNWLEQIRNEF